MTKDIPSNVVCGGNPASVICDIKSLHDKRIIEKNDFTRGYDAIEMKKYFWANDEMHNINSSMSTCLK